MEKPLLIEAQPASNLDTIFEHHLAKKTDGQPKFHAQTPDQFTLMFPPERQTVTGIAGEFEAQLLDRCIPALLLVLTFERSRPVLLNIHGSNVLRVTEISSKAVHRGRMEDWKTGQCKDGLR